MTLPASFWTSLAFLILTAMLCRRWSLLALHGATGAFCAALQMALLRLPETSETVFADTVLFMLPTVPLCAAAGLPDMKTAACFVVVPLACFVHVYVGSEARAVFLPLAIAAVQGTIAVHGIANREWKSKSFAGMQRWGATCVAAIGTIGLGFVPFWSDVAWTGVAANAFVCLAYLANENEQ